MKQPVNNHNHLRAKTVKYPLNNDHVSIVISKGRIIEILLGLLKVITTCFFETVEKGQLQPANNDIKQLT